MIFGFLNKTKEIFKGLSGLFKKKLDEEILEKMKEMLLLSDVGLSTTNYILQKLEEKKEEIEKSENGIDYYLKQEMIEILNKNQKMVDRTLKKNKPTILFIVGVNGVGKTTTISKLCKLYQDKGRKIVIGAGDLNRVGAVSQLEILANKTETKIIKKEKIEETEMVVYESIKYCIDYQYDLCIIDTAGRLQNNYILMNQLDRMIKISNKSRKGSPDYIWMVIDGHIGQNNFIQTREFHKKIKINGIIVTKMDGTAKAGIILSIAHELKIPILYLTKGESLNDIIEFETETFVQSLL